MFTMFMIAIVLVSSSTWYQTNAGRLHNLERKLYTLEMSVERKLHSLETSVIQDIRLLREDINLAKEKMEEVLTPMNSTTSLPLDTSMTEEDEHKLAKRIEMKMEALVVQQLKRVKRAFVSEKMQLVAKQQEQESNRTTHAQSLKNPSETLTEKTDSSINSSSSALQQSFDMNVDTIDEQELKIQEAVNKAFLRVERSFNSSLLEIAEKQEEHLNTMTDKLGNGINKILQIGENSRINELLILQAIQSTRLTSLMTLRMQSTSKLSDRNSQLAGYLQTCMNLRTQTFEHCRAADVHAISELTDLGKGVRLGNSSIIDGGVQGRLEVFYADEWGTVCDDRFSNKIAKVACRMLGYPNGDFKDEAYFGQGSNPILFDDIACSGEENSLVDCPGIKGPGRPNCRHNEDVGVICRD